MAGKGKRASGFEAELKALSGLDARSDEGRARLEAGLDSRHSHVVARAARLVKDHAVEGLEAALGAAFDRLLGAPDPVKADPTCAAKLAALEALDFAESNEAGRFLRASAYEQWEKAWGPPVDTAEPLRARAVVGLARIGHPDFDLVAARLLGDQAAPVRQSALEALGLRGERAHAALAYYKVRQGDEEPLVTLAAMSALLALAPAWAIAELARLLDGKDDRRELAAVALGQTRSDEALAALLGALERCATSSAREPLLRGLGLHRSERALAALVEVIAGRNPADARVAIEALGARRFEPAVAARVRAVAQANPRLRSLIDEVFGPDAT